MTTTKSVDRMYGLVQEMKLHYLTQPDPGVNSDQDFTLSWPLGASKVTLVLGSSILLHVNEPERETVTLNLTGYTDSEILDVIIRWGLIETKKSRTV